MKIMLLGGTFHDQNDSYSEPTAVHIVYLHSAMSSRPLWEQFIQEKTFLHEKNKPGEVRSYYSQASGKCTGWYLISTSRY